MEKLLTVDELSGMLRISKSTIYRWVHYGFVPHVKLGGAVRFDEASVQSWLRKRECRGRATLPVEVEPVSRD
jgi:excisionase family DNA binding protein